MRTAVAKQDVIDVDQALLRRVRRGEAPAFQMLVERWQTMVFSLHFRMTGSREHAEDLSQETFLRAYQKISDFEGSSRFSTWLYSIARNLCLDHLKRRRVPEVHDETEHVSPEPSPERGVSLREDVSRLQRLLLELPEGPREAFVLRHVEGLEYEEIAERCSTTVNNVKVRVHRAREALARAMGDDDGIA